MSRLSIRDRIDEENVRDFIIEAIGREEYTRDDRQTIWWLDTTIPIEVSDWMNEIQPVLVNTLSMFARKMTDSQISLIVDLIADIVQEMF